MLPKPLRILIAIEWASVGISAVAILISFINSGIDGGSIIAGIWSLYIINGIKQHKIAAIRFEKIMIVLQGIGAFLIVILANTTKDSNGKYGSIEISNVALTVFAIIILVVAMYKWYLLKEKDSKEFISKNF